jgi:hypothetical protein
MSSAFSLIGHVSEWTTQRLRIANDEEGDITFDSRNIPLASGAEIEYFFAFRSLVYLNCFRVLLQCCAFICVALQNKGSCAYCLHQPFCVFCRTPDLVQTPTFSFNTDASHATRLQASIFLQPNGSCKVLSFKAFFPLLERCLLYICVIGARQTGRRFCAAHYWN